jgi:hypothetical protein
LAQPHIAKRFCLLFTAQPLRLADNQPAKFSLIFKRLSSLRQLAPVLQLRKAALSPQGPQMECEVVMLDAQEARTVAVKACAACDGGLLESDKFCRWCGSRQLDSASSPKAKDSELINCASAHLTSENLTSKNPTLGNPTFENLALENPTWENLKSRDSASRDLLRYRTSALDQSGTLLYRRVSGPLVDAVVAGVAVHSNQERNHFMRRAILALISIPIWLIIVLLSPLDAYAAAKNLLR